MTPKEYITVHWKAKRKLKFTYEMFCEEVDIYASSHFGTSLSAANSVLWTMNGDLAIKASDSINSNPVDFYRSNDGFTEWMAFVKDNWVDVLPAQSL